MARRKPRAFPYVHCIFAATGGNYDRRYESVCYFHAIALGLRVYAMRYLDGRYTFGTLSRVFCLFIKCSAVTAVTRAEIRRGEIKIDKKCRKQCILYARDVCA